MTIRHTVSLIVLALISATSAAVAQDPPPVETDLFTLHNDVRVDLHHFLVNVASQEADQRPPWATPLDGYEAVRDALSPAERATWERAVDTYAATVGRSFVFDDGLVAVRDVVAGLGTQSAVPEADRPLLAAVAAALPVYRRHWWPAHREQNDAWIESVAPILREVEGGIAGRLVHAYGGTWPEGRTRVDVVAYANAVDAYSTGGVVTIGTGEPGNQVPQGIEILFHEASHTEPLETPLRELVRRAFRAEGATVHDRFWHDVIFYTTGEATRLELARIGRPEYAHYGAAGLYGRNERWPPQLAAFDAHWRPYLESGDEGDDAREAALRRVAAELAQTR